MPIAYKKIASATVTGATQAEIDFTSIPATYTDLVLKYSLRSNTANQQTDGLYLKVNNSAANMTARWVYGNGQDTPVSSNGTNPYIGFTPGTSTTSTFGNGELYIPNYAGNTNKSISNDNGSEANQTIAYFFFHAVLWSQTTAINQLTLYFANPSNVFAQHSSATLYGISKS